MEWIAVKSAWGALVASVVGLVGLFGWSHNKLRMRMDNIELSNRYYLTERDARRVIDDKLAPVHVEYKAITDRIDSLVYSQRELDHKIERLLNLLSAHDRQRRNSS